MASRGRARSTATDRGRARGELGEVVRGARSTSSGGPARPPNPDTLLRIGVLEEKDAEREVERGTKKEELVCFTYIKCWWNLENIRPVIDTYNVRVHINASCIKRGSCG